MKVHRRAIASIALSLVVAACSDDGTVVSSSVSTTSGTSTGSVATATTTVAPATTAPVARNYDFAKPEVIATGLTVPWGIAFLPDGSALVAERISGRILQLRAGSAPQAVMTIPGVSPNGEGGLLGLATSPTYSHDGLVYAYYTTTTDNRVARFRLGTTPAPTASSTSPRATPPPVLAPRTRRASTARSFASKPTDPPPMATRLPWMDLRSKSVNSSL